MTDDSDSEVDRVVGADPRVSADAGEYASPTERDASADPGADAGGAETRGQVDPAAVKRRLQSMDDFAFETFVAALWARRGWQTEVEQQSGDAGVDVRAVTDQPYRRKALIQAKRYRRGNNVGGPSVQQYAALRQQEDNVDEVVVVTTSDFTDPARQRARELNVKLVDGDDLAAMVVDLGATDLLGGDLPTQQASGTGLGWIPRPVRTVGLIGCLLAQAVAFGTSIVTGDPLGPTLNAVGSVGWLGGAALVLVDVRLVADSEWPTPQGRLAYQVLAFVPVAGTLAIATYLLRRERRAD